MKKRWSSLAVFCMTVVLLVTSLFTGCSEEEEIAISYQKESVSCGLFQYLCSQKKTDYLYEAYGIDKSTLSSSQLQDNPAIWKAKSEDGQTVAEKLKEDALAELKLYMYMSNYAKSKGYSMGTNEKNYVKNEFNKVVSSYGDKDTFNREMEQYGVDYDQLLEFNYLQTMAYQGMNLLFGENGTQRISDESLMKYYKNNYATVGCIYINTKTKTYANGKVVGMPEEEKQEKIALADQVFAKVQAGEDFVTLALEYSDQDIDEAAAKKGYTFKKGGFVNTQAEEKVWTMKTGDFARVDTENGVYILVRRPLNEAYFESIEETIRTELEEEKKQAMVSKAESAFEINEEFIKNLNIAEIPHVV